ncbi:hypothetical protein RSSE_c3249 [Ralstonia solanacearum]|nr:hypothetical protein RSSE_c3249 [Ralstonia solanacearum]
MAKSTGTVTVKRSRNGTTIRATGSAAQALFDAMVKSAEQAANELPVTQPSTTTTESQPAADQQQN